MESIIENKSKDYVNLNQPDRTIRLMHAVASSMKDDLSYFESNAFLNFMNPLYTNEDGFNDSRCKMEITLFLKSNGEIMFKENQKLFYSQGVWNTNDILQSLFWLSKVGTPADTIEIFLDDYLYISETITDNYELNAEPEDHLTNQINICLGLMGLKSEVKIIDI